MPLPEPAPGWGPERAPEGIPEGASEGIPERAQPEPDPEVVRYGPGVPPSQAAAESVWRTGRPLPPTPGQVRRRRLRRLLGLAVTLILLAVAGVVLWLRFFNHSPLGVTSVRFAHEVKNGCAVDVTGVITTNGSAGIISYQWEFQPQTEAPQRLSQSVTSRQHAADVTISIQGQGHGSAAQTVILHVLSPGDRSASTAVSLTC
jgi:hypothetical protein